MKLGNQLLFLIFSILFLAKLYVASSDTESEEMMPEIIDDDAEEGIPPSEDLEALDTEEELSGIVDTTKYPGRIISRKKVKSDTPAVGQPLTIEYTIWNVGNSDVVDVELSDDSYSAEDFSGPKKIEIKQAKIAPGKSYTETHSVTPNREGQIRLSPARITYKSRTSTENEELIQYSSEGATDGIVPVATAAVYARKHAKHYIDWICFLVLALPTTIVPYMNANNLITRYSLKPKSS